MVYEIWLAFQSSLIFLYEIFLKHYLEHCRIQNTPATCFKFSYSNMTAWPQRKPMKLWYVSFETECMSCIREQLLSGRSRMFVIIGRHFFLPPFSCGKKISGPLLTYGKTDGPLQLKLPYQNRKALRILQHFDSIKPMPW